MLPQPPAATRSSSAVQTTPSIMPPPYSDDMYVRNGGLSSLQDNKEMSIDINLKTPAHNHGFIHDSYSPFLQDTSHKPMPQQYRRSVSEPFTMGIDLPRPHTMNSPPLNGHAVKNSPVLKNGYKVLPKEETFSLKATPEKSLLHSSQQQQRPSPITLSERSSRYSMPPSIAHSSIIQKLAYLFWKNMCISIASTVTFWKRCRQTPKVYNHILYFFIYPGTEQLN